MDAMQWSPTNSLKKQSREMSDEEERKFRKSMRRESTASPRKTSKKARSNDQFTTQSTRNERMWQKRKDGIGICLYTIEGVLYQKVTRSETRLICNGTLELFQTHEGHSRLEFFDEEFNECILTIPIDSNVDAKIALNPRMIILNDEYLLKVKTAEISGILFEMISQISIGFRVRPDEALELLSTSKTRKKITEKPESYVHTCSSPMVIYDYHQNPVSFQ